MTTETRNDKRTRGGPRKLKSRASRNRPRAAIRQKQPQFLEFFDRYKGTLPESISQADLILLNAALSFLFAHLREARRQFDEEGDAGRLGAFTALGALVQFILIFKKPNSDILHTPILRLQDALVTLDKIPCCRSSHQRGDEDAVSLAKYMRL